MTLKELKKFIKSIPKEYDNCDIKMFLDEELGYEMDLDNLVVVHKPKLDTAYTYPCCMFDKEKKEFVFLDEKELRFIRDFEVEEYKRAKTEDYNRYGYVESFKAEVKNDNQRT